MSRASRSPVDLCVLEHLPEPAAVLDGNGRIQGVSREWLHLARRNGLTTDPVGRPYAEVCAKSGGPGQQAMDECRPALEAVLRGKQDRLEQQYAWTGEQWFLARFVALPDGGTLVTHTDITRQKQNELELVRSRELYRVVTECMSDAVFCFDFRRGKIPHLVWLNGDLVHEFFRNPGRMRRTDWLRLVSRSEARKLVRLVQLVVRTGRAETVMEVHDLRGNLRWIRTRIRFAAGAEDGSGRILGAAEDVTSQRALELLMLERGEYLSALNESSQKLIQSHDLRGAGEAPESRRRLSGRGGLWRMETDHTFSIQRSLDS